MSPGAYFIAPDSDRRSVLRVEFQCSLNAARAAGTEVRQFLAAEGLTDSELDGWELAIVEGANNAVNYTPELRRDLSVVIEAAIGSSCTEVRITDHTDGFDFPDVADLPDGDAESGRGLFLIRALSDSADYLRGRNANVLILSKNRERARRKLPAPSVDRLEAELDLMTEELAASYESLSAIFTFTSTLANAKEPMDLVEPWMKELARVAGADWHAFYILAPDGCTLKCMAASSSDVPPAIMVTLEETSAAARAVRMRQDVWFEASTPLAPSDPLELVSEGTSGLVHGVFLGPSLIGLVALGRRVGHNPFTAGQVNVIHTFSDFLGTQVRNAQVQRESTQHQLMRRDLEIAAGIQQSLLPDALPRTPGLEIYGSATSAREVGGDFYDVIGFPNGSVLVVIADVMGKGVPAAMFAAILRALIRSRRDLASQPGELLKWVATTLFVDLDRVEMFATMQLVYFDLLASCVHVAGAGHCPLLIARVDGAISEIPSHGVPIGILQNSTYLESEHKVELGSRLLLFTDGVTESRDASGEHWGMDRLRTWLISSPASSPKQLGDALLEEIVIHRGLAPVPDDITFVLLSTHS